MQGALSERWGTVEELLATLVELVDSFRMLWLRANSDEQARIPDPVRIPRPGEKKAAPPRVSMRDFARRLKG